MEVAQKFQSIHGIRVHLTRRHCPLRSLRRSGGMTGWQSKWHVYMVAATKSPRSRTDVTPLVSPKSSTANGLSKDMK